MEKKKVQEKIVFNVNWSWSLVDIADIRKDLMTARKIGATHIDFEECNIQFCKLRSETNAEYSTRVGNAAKIEAKERAEYERLKAKFEKL